MIYGDLPDVFFLQRHHHTCDAMAMVCQEAALEAMKDASEKVKIRLGPWIGRSTGMSMLSLFTSIHPKKKKNKKGYPVILTQSLIAL